MLEQKVLNKYYLWDFDPSKIPKLKLPKDWQYMVALMAPCNMRCKTCREYIYKGKKFSAHKETVQDEVYLSLPIFHLWSCLVWRSHSRQTPRTRGSTMPHGTPRLRSSWRSSRSGCRRSGRTRS